MERALLQLLETQTSRPMDEDDRRESARILAGALAATADAKSEPIDLRAFLPFVLERVEAGAVSRQLEQLDLAGLYLAFGCISGHHRAQVQFERELGATIRRCLAKLGLAEPQIDEVQQAVRLKLFGSSQPKLQGFSGRGTLRNWVRAVALREGLSYRRRLPAEHDTISQLGAGGDPELAYLEHTYREAFREALRTALSGLGEGDRLVLRLRIKEGLTLDEVATALGVHRATGARRLARARENVWRRTRQELIAQLKIDPREFESVLRMVRSHMDMSLSGVL